MNQRFTQAKISKILRKSKQTVQILDENGYKNRIKAQDKLDIKHIDKLFELDKDKPKNEKSS